MSDENWGVKYTIHVYIEGTPPTKLAFRSSEEACKVFEDNGYEVDFSGVSKTFIRDRPMEQGGS